MGLVFSVGYLLFFSLLDLGPGQTMEWMCEILILDNITQMFHKVVFSLTEVAVATSCTSSSLAMQASL